MAYPKDHLLPATGVSAFIGHVMGAAVDWLISERTVVRRHKVNIYCLLVIVALGGTLLAPSESANAGALSLFDEPRVVPSQELLKQLPEKLKCGSTQLVIHDQHAKIVHSKIQKGVFVDQKTKTRVLVDLTDGNQVEAYSFSRSDLLELSRGNMETVEATSIGGFWQNDGGHLSTTDITCSMSQKL